MKLKRLIIVLFCSLLLLPALAQEGVMLNNIPEESELLTKLPETEAEFITSEKKVLATIDWLINSPLKKNDVKRKSQYILLMAWLTNSPTVTIELNVNTVTFTEKNPDLLIIFMAGWTRYALENNYSKDLIQGNLAGIRSSIKFYQSNKLKKDKNLLRLIEIEEEGKLEEWVSKQLNK